MRLSFFLLAVLAISASANPLPLVGNIDGPPNGTSPNSPQPPTADEASSLLRWFLEGQTDKMLERDPTSTMPPSTTRPSPKCTQNHGKLREELWKAEVRAKLDPPFIPTYNESVRYSEMQEVLQFKELQAIHHQLEFNCSFDDFLASTKQGKTRKENGVKCSPRKIDASQFYTSSNEPIYDKLSKFVYAFSAKYSCPNQEYNISWVADLHETAHNPNSNCPYDIEITNFSITRSNGSGRSEDVGDSSAILQLEKRTGQGLIMKFHDYFSQEGKTDGGYYLKRYKDDYMTSLAHHASEDMFNIFGLHRVEKSCENVQQNESPLQLFSGIPQHLYNCTYSPPRPGVATVPPLPYLDLGLLVRFVNGGKNPCGDFEHKSDVVGLDQIATQIVEHTFNADIPSIQTIQRAHAITTAEKIYDHGRAYSRETTRSDIDVELVYSAYTHPMQHLQVKHVIEMYQRRVVDCEKYNNVEFNDFLQQGLIYRALRFWQYYTLNIDCKGLVQGMLKQKNNFVYAPQLQSTAHLQ